MVKIGGIKGKQGSNEFIQTTLSYEKIRLLLNSFKYEDLKNCGVSNFNIMSCQKKIKTESFEIVILANRKNVMFDTPSFEDSSMPGAYKMASRSIVFASIKNKSSHLMKGHRTLQEFENLIENNIYIDSNQEFPVLILIREDENESFDKQFCLINKMGFNNADERIAFNVCDTGSLSIEKGSFNFISYGSTISNRTTSVTLFKNILSIVKSSIVRETDEESITNVINETWKFMVGELDVFKNIINDPSLIKNYRTSDSTYYLIFKPALNQALFELFYVAIQQGKEKELASTLNHTDFSSNKKWEHIIVDEAGRVIPKNREAVVKYFKDLVNLN